MNKNYCPKCGLQYRKWSIEVEKQVCEDCDSIEYEKLRKTNITRIKKRQVGQKHISENTWFPTSISSRFGINWNKYYRRENR
mgnify:CR=1 FL=1|tara:strand:+ start:599 stop:844 length:246 start_codon:yes stop_codon:yes gene_type:complete